VDDLLFNHSDSVDVGEEFTLMLSTGEDPLASAIEEEDTIGTFDDDDDDDDHAFLIDTHFDLDDDLDNPFCDVLRSKFTAKKASLWWLM
jgi:hypothetical protein